MKTSLFAIAVVAVLGGAYLSAYPEPAVVPADTDWTLNVLFNQPEQITVKTAKLTASHLYLTPNPCSIVYIGPPAVKPCLSISR